jgi:adenylyltransferase/sulfurtransferase
VPGRGPCYRCLFPTPPADGLVPNCAEAGVLGVLPGVLGTIQATEAIKLITGSGEPLIGRLLTYDALEMRFAEFRFAQRPDCAVCGENPTITAPFDPSVACETDMTTQNLRRLSPAEVQALLQQTGFTIIDVREPYEYAAGHLANSMHIPLGELPQRLGEIPAGTTPVFLCRSGGRSLAACNIALSSGASEAINLEGGLRAWAAAVDPTITVA